MVTLKDREIAFESKFAHDAEMQFRAEARRASLLGLWAAGLMGLSGEAAADYAREVVRCDCTGPGDGAVFRKVSADLGSRADASRVRAKMATLLARAKAQLIDEY